MKESAIISKLCSDIEGKCAELDNMKLNISSMEEKCKEKENLLVKTELLLHETQQTVDEFGVRIDALNEDLDVKDKLYDNLKEDNEHLQEAEAEKALQITSLKRLVDEKDGMI